MGLRHAPFAFTEHGILMLSSILRSQKAAQVNIAIMRVFLHLREIEGKPVTITQEEVRGVTEILSADEVNVLEEAVQQGIESLTFKPYEVKFLRLMSR